MPLDPLDMLNEMQRTEVEAALKDPEARERFMVAALVGLRDTVNGLELRDRDAKQQCLNVCRPAFVTRFERLERFRSWLCGIGAALVALAGLGLTLWGLLK